MAQVNETERHQLSSQKFFTVQEAADYLRISKRSMYRLIQRGEIITVKIMSKMTRITLDELLKLAHSKGYDVIMPNETFPRQDAETGSVNKSAKCRKSPRAGERAPDGVTHDTHYTMAEVLSTFNIKYGRFYEVRNRYQLQSVHAWGTTCFKKEDVERVIGLYNEEQGKNISDDWYTCFDIMKLYGLGKTQVRRFAESHGVRIRKFKGGRANYYLKADWEAARKKAEKSSTSTKAKRK